MLKRSINLNTVSMPFKMNITLCISYKGWLYGRVVYILVIHQPMIRLALPTVSEI